MNEEGISSTSTTSQSNSRTSNASPTQSSSSYLENFPTRPRVCPVRSEPFCNCYKSGRERDCSCGEDDEYFEWTWDEHTKSTASLIKQDEREVVFHVDYSCGTAAVRGATCMKEDQYYWEVKMTTPVYGTDMMIGVGTEHIDLDKYRHMFCSLIGMDNESWGLSYSGQIHHSGVKEPYSTKFGQGTIVGVHLDMWHGMLSFYKNRKPMGSAYRGLNGKNLYPMVSSTAARSGMKVIKCRSFKTSLQFMCCLALRKAIPAHMNVLRAVDLPPGLREFLENNISWLLGPIIEHVDRCSHKRKADSDSESTDGDSESECITSKRMRHLM